MKRINIAILAILIFCFAAFSYSYNAFSLMTGKSTFAINPYSSVSCQGIFNQKLHLAYGITDRIDLWLNSEITPQEPSGDVSIMLRADVSGKGTIAALRANNRYISPQFHHIWENHRLILQTNLISKFKYDDLKNPSVYGVVSPGIKLLNGLFDVFCEVNPGYYAQNKEINNYQRNAGFGLDLVPGVGFFLGKSLFSVGVPIYDVTNAPKASFGAWWFYTITRK